ncbi:MAG: polyprenyl synthetase family protein [Methylobacteriaceae bacterium]|nr:polyprenyl synthetase family protein [Methylobacteriaceae bacterium]
MSSASSVSVFALTLNRRAAQVDQFLERALSPEGEDKTKPWPTRLKNAMRHGVLGGGKRIRPFLVIETVAMLGGDEKCALRAGAALELVHCYSLIHDDLPAMDDDDLRRGRPTVHCAFDEATAILAGDALLTLAFEIMAARETHPDAAVRAECVTILAKAAGAGAMVGGQMLDLAAEGRFGDPAPDAEGVRLLQAMKTGAMLTAALELGGVIAGADAPRRRLLERFGRALGAAYQIADDILDRESTTEALGKRAGKDRGKGKGTLVDLLGMDRARAECRELSAEAMAALEPFGPSADTLRAAFGFTVARST